MFFRVEVVKTISPLHQKDEDLPSKYHILKDLRKILGFVFFTDHTRVARRDRGVEGWVEKLGKFHGDHLKHEGIQTPKMLKNSGVWDFCSDNLPRMTEVLVFC